MAAILWGSIKGKLKLLFKETPSHLAPYIADYGSSQDANKIIKTLFMYTGRQSSIGIATGYGLDGPGIESRWEG
jgi:hypothetical protein